MEVKIWIYYNIWVRFRLNLECGNLIDSVSLINVGIDVFY